MLKSISRHKSSDILIRLFIVLSILGRLRMRVELLQCLLMQIERDLLSASNVGHIRPFSVFGSSTPETAHPPVYHHHHTKCRKPRTWETNLSVCPKQCHQNGPHIREIFFAATAYKGHFSPLETQDNPFAAKFFWIVCRTVSTVYPYCWICSLPTDWEPSSLYIPTLSGPFSPKG